MDDIRINIKPLSVNDAWQGKRFKSPAYKEYEKLMLCLLPVGKLPEPPYRIYYEFGFSNTQADYDNPCKPLGDILQKKYLFNDKDIYEACIRKRIVKKGEEYIRVRIIHIDIEGYGTKSKSKRASKQIKAKGQTEAVGPDSRISCQR